MNVLAELKERGFIENSINEKELNDFLNKCPATCYIGFDPTASSLHVGSLVPIMALVHMQKHGHRPIALIGGGTGLVGDPSGKTEMRKILTLDAVEWNVRGIRRQLSEFIDFNDKKAILLNNAEWLSKIEYIPFLRDIGRHFSVNRMIKAESYKIRLESEEGLNFIEFNYMLLQAFDFLMLFDQYDCRIQMGGSDQWGNILAGIELIRRARQETVCGITFPLIITSSGAKMGKTAKGAVWLDKEKTSPYEYFQYWINTDDSDAARFLALFTLLPMDEIRAVDKVKGEDLNSAKAVLAFEATKLAHGKDEAKKAYNSSAGMFGSRAVPNTMMPSSTIPRDISEVANASIPHSYIDETQLKKGIPAFKLYHEIGLANSGSASRRLIEQGGAYINGHRIDSFDYLVTDKDINDAEIVLRAGKKKYHKILIKN